MGTYYKHTKTESIDVPYSFRCEQCHKDSGMQSATISGRRAEINSNFKKLSDSKQQKLAKMAHEHLVSAVKDAYRNASEKQIYCKEFRDECPYCHAPQSWAVSGVKQEMFSTPVVCAVIGIILGAGSYVTLDDENRLIIAAVVAGICFALAAGILIWNIIKVEKKKKQTSAVLQRNVPVIEWGVVQHLINE